MIKADATNNNDGCTKAVAQQQQESSISKPKSKFWRFL